MKGALDVHRELLARGIPHEIVQLRRTVVSVDELPDVLGLPPSACVAVRVHVVSCAGDPVGGEPRLVAVLVAVGARPDPAALLSGLGASALRLASVEEINAGTDFSAGLVSPVCLPREVTALADAALDAADVVYTPTGEGGTVLGIHTRDLLVASGARVGRLTRPDPIGLVPVTGTA